MDEPPDQNINGTQLGQDETGESFADRMFMGAQTVDKYYTPILFIIGTLGNSLSLAVFCMNAKYRSQSASYYLSALAISDTGFLVSLLAVWLESVHGGIITSGLMCPLVMYLGQVTCFLSVYLTVAFSIERYVAVHYPLSRPRICTRSKARKVIASLTGVALLFFSYAWVIAQVIEFPSGNDYEELYGENPTQRSAIPNLTQDNSSEFYSFPVGRRDKREAVIFNSKLLASKELHSIYDVGSPNFLKQLPNCSNGSHLNTYNKSIHSQDHNQALNCTRLHLDGNILKGFRKSYHFPEYSSEESSSASEESFSSEYEKNVTSEDFLLSGGYICSVPKDYFRISEIANYLDTVVTLIIPFFLITFINVRIAICVWKLQRQRLNIVATSSSGTSDINHHHHHSLRCSNKGSIHHHKRKLSSTKRRPSNKNSSRQHLSEQSCTNSLRENEMGVSNSVDFDCERANHTASKSKKGTVRFQETRYRSDGTMGAQGNGDRSSSSGNEGEICDDNTASPGNDGGVSSGLNLTPKGMATTETLQQTKFLGKFTPVRGSKNSRFHGGAKLEQKHKSVPPRVTAKSDFSLTRERRPNTHSHPPPSNAAEVRVTKTLLLVSTVFLVLNLPAHAIRCAQFIQTLRGTSEGHELLHAAQPWTNLLFNTNFAVNFLLYCLSGRNFRKTLRNIILRKFSKKIPNTAWRSMSQTTKQEAILNSNKKTRGKGELPARRNIRTAELEVAEIVELEERGEVSIYPNNNTNTVNHSREVVLEVDQSLPV